MPNKTSDIHSAVLVNGWNKWGKHVVLEMGRLDECYQNLDKKIDTLIRTIGKMRIEIAVLKVKSGIWGGAAGLLSTFGVIYALIKVGVLKFV